MKSVLIAVVAALLLLNSLINVGKVSGESMLPTIPNQSYLLGVSTQNYDIGDVVCYYKPGENKTVVHRIVWKSEGWLTNTERCNFYRTQGDNNEIPDRYLITEHDIIYKVIAIVHIIGGKNGGS